MPASPLFSTPKRCLLAVVAAIGLTASASAELIDRGSGLIYDTVLNVTWLQDANYAKTSGYNATGGMIYKEAQAWAANLRYHDTVRGTTLTGWRLPKTGPINGVSFDLLAAGLDGFGMYNGGSDIGWWMSAPGSAYAGAITNEMAHLHYHTLGNRGTCGAPGELNSNVCSADSPNPLDIGFGYGGTAYVPNHGPFINLGNALYWGGDLPTPRTIYTDRDAFAFNFSIGLQHAYSNKTTTLVWVVRDGDVTAPNPTVAPPVVVTPPTTGVTLTVKLGSGKGAVTSSNGAINCGKTCSATMVSGTVLSLTAAPEPGFHFVNWTGACTGNTPVCMLNISANVQAVANFVK